LTRVVRIGTRGSQLALAQATWIQKALQSLHPELDCPLVTIRTSGDRIADRSLRAIGGKGLFVKEIEEALLSRDIDCAVHSMKDLPAELAPGLVIAAVPEREDARDLLITRDGGGLAALRTGARIGTGSLRRMAFLRCTRRDLEIDEIRGNVDTRLRKLDAGEFDAVVLAAAGLARLGIRRQHAHAFDDSEFVPAIGQGALAIECRAGDLEALLAGLDHGATHVATDAERSFLARIGVQLNAAVASPDGSCVIRGSTSGPVDKAKDLGTTLAERLLDDGAAEILEKLERTSPALSPGTT